MALKRKTATLWVIWFAAFLAAGMLFNPIPAESASEDREVVRTLDSVSTHFSTPLSVPQSNDVRAPRSSQTTAAEYTGSCSLDVDQDGTINALTDGLLVYRYLEDYRGDDLVRGALGSDARRTDPDEITAFLDSQSCQDMLDIDASDSINANTSGVLATRYMFGYSGDDLVGGAIGQGAQRSSSGQVRAWLAMYRQPASHIRLTAPTLNTPLQSGVESSFQPGIEYTGTRDVRFHLLDGPQDINLSSRSGRLSWIPGPEHEGQEIEIRVSATDGDAYANLAFSVRVAQPRPVQTTQSQTDDGRTRITVTEDTGNLQGLDVVLPGQVASSGRVMSSRDMAASMSGSGVSVVDEADVDVDAIPDDVIRLTDFFRIDAMSAGEDGWIEIVFPDLELPEGRYPDELILFVYDQPMGIERNIWVSTTYGLNIIDGQRVSIYTALTGQTCFIGVKESTRDRSALDSNLIHAQNVEETITLESGENVSVSCVKDIGWYWDGFPPVLRYGRIKNDVDICTVNMDIDGNVEDFEFEIEGLHDEDGNRVPNWNPQPSAHEISGWLLDAVLKFNEYGLEYDRRGTVTSYTIKLKIEPLEDYGYVSNMDRHRVLHVNSWVDYEDAIEMKALQGTTVHEYFHHAQNRTGNILKTLTESDGMREARMWAYEGTAVWFEDEAHDDNDPYLLKKDNPSPMILDVGLASEHGLSASNAYNRFTFFKLLQRTNSETWGCDFEDTFLPDFFGNHRRGNGGSGRLSDVMSDENHNCYFGDTFGQESSNSLSAALERYTWATQIKNDITLIDHNETVQDFFQQTHRDLTFPDYGLTCSYHEDIYLAPLSAMVFKLEDETNPGHNRSISTSVQQGPRALATIRDSAGELRHSFNTSEQSNLVLLDSSGQSPATVNGWYATFVNDHPDQSIELRVSAHKGEQNTLVAIQEPINNSTLTNRVIDISGTVDDDSAHKVEVKNSSAGGFTVELNLSHGAFSGMIPIAMGDNSISVQALDASGNDIGASELVNVVGQEHPDPSARNALVESQMVFSLSWDQARDMDIHITDPHGRKIWYGNRTVRDSQGYTYGRLDHDNTSGFGPGATNSPEVVTYFSDMNRNDDMQGCYEIKLHYYSSSGPATNLTLDMLLNESQENERTGRRIEDVLTTPRSWSDSIYIHCQNTSGGKMKCERDLTHCEDQIQALRPEHGSQVLPEKN